MDIELTDEDLSHVVRTRDGRIRLELSDNARQNFDAVIVSEGIWRKMLLANIEVLREFMRGKN